MIVSRDFQQEMELLINLVRLLDGFLSREDLASGDDAQNLFQCLQQVAEYKDQVELADFIVKTPKCIKTLVSFATLVFEG